MDTINHIFMTTSVLMSCGDIDYRAAIVAILGTCIMWMVINFVIGFVRAYKDEMNKYE
jgi:hypothetical protein